MFMIRKLLGNTKDLVSSVHKAPNSVEDNRNQTVSDIGQVSLKQTNCIEEGTNKTSDIKASVIESSKDSDDNGLVEPRDYS